MPPRLPSNEHLDYIASLLDDMWRIPGTKVRFGLDAIVGWIPGIGDAMAGAASCVIVFAVVAAGSGAGDARPDGREHPPGDGGGRGAGGGRHLPRLLEGESEELSDI